MAKQQQHKTARRRTPMGSKYNNAVVPKMEDKHKQTKTQVVLFENNKKSSKIEITVNGSVLIQVKEKKILEIIVDEKLTLNHILNTFVQKPGNHMVALQQSPCYLQQVMSQSISPS